MVNKVKVHHAITTRGQYGANGLSPLSTFLYY